MDVTKSSVVCCVPCMTSLKSWCPSPDESGPLILIMIQDVTVKLLNYHLSIYQKLDFTGGHVGIEIIV